MIGKNILLIVAVICMFLTSCQEEESHVVPDKKILKGDKQAGRYSWTFMIYVDGDNNLEPDALDDINEMEFVDLDNEGITVIVLVDRSRNYSIREGDWTGTRLYRITPDSDEGAIRSERLEDHDYLHLTNSGDNEELNMGNPRTLENFISFCQNKYPADKYGLVLWNHGDGWRSRQQSESNPSSVSQSTFENSNNAFQITPHYIGTQKAHDAQSFNKAICYDETSGGDWLYMDELKDAVSGKNIDLLGFDACLMGMIEVAYELKEHIAYMVGSEEVEPSSGWVYDQFLYQAIKLSDNAAEHIGKKIVDTYISHTEYSNITLSLLDLSNLDFLVAALDQVVSGLLSEDVDTICNMRQETHNFDNYHSIDLLHFIERLPSSSAVTQLKEAFHQTVIYNQTRGVSGANGLAIYFPYYYTFDQDYPYYNESVLDFAKDAEWKSLLSYYFSNVKTYTIETFANKDSATTDTYLMVFNANGEALCENDDKSTSDRYSKIVMPLARNEKYYIACFDEWGFAGPYSILIDEDGNGVSTGNPDKEAYEPNDEFSSATPLFLGQVQDHYLSYGDVDWMVVEVP